MCRLFAFKGKTIEPPYVKELLIEGISFRCLACKHKDGWGVGWYENNIPQVTKKPESALDSDDYKRVIQDLKTNYFAVHLRLASKGQQILENCHPFSYKKWIFAHNGTINNFAQIKNRLESSYVDQIKGTTDSEVFFYWLLQNIEESGDPKTGIEKALYEINEFTSLNFVLMNPSSVYCYRDAADKEKLAGYYTLYYLLFDNNGEINPHNDASFNSIIISSEKSPLLSYPASTWKELPPKHLLIVKDYNLTIKEIK